MEEALENGKESPHSVHANGLIDYRVEGIDISLHSTSPVLQGGRIMVQSCFHLSILFPQQLNLLKPTGYVMHQQFNSQQLYVLPTLYLCVLYLSENKQRLVPLTA